MQTANSIAACRAAVAAARASGRSIGFVPTMGALHEGHLALVDASRARAAWTALSVFVNPLQFAPGEDYDRYPRDLARDAELAAERDVDLMFAPEPSEMYPRPQEVSVRAGALGSDWEGRIRPGHFDGVLTVVAKLFNIIQPDLAVFGQKDLQQAQLVRVMVRDLNMPVEIAVVPTARDPDGLALSSRNRYLSPDERARALALSQALRATEEAYAGGERDVAALEEKGHARLLATPGIRIDYMAVVELESFRRPAHLAGPGAAIGAIRAGSTRLIDNVLLGSETPG